jgi:hypothetical protein
VNEIVEMLQKAVKEKFWGQVEFTFHDGEVTLVRKTETIKLNKGAENNRHNEQRNRR